MRPCALKGEWISSESTFQWQANGATMVFPENRVVSVGIRAELGSIPTHSCTGSGGYRTIRSSRKAQAQCR